MKLSFVEMEGFRGFRDKTRVEFSGEFVVLTGRNGSGKSTVLDAIEFALTGTISKFDVTAAKGGGLDEHIWWVGSGKPLQYKVTVGFVDEFGKDVEVARSRQGGANLTEIEILRHLVRGDSTATQLSTLLDTTLIRDEKISALSLDLPGQARFAALRAAIGGLVGTDYTPRTKSIFESAKAAKERQEHGIRESQAELGRVLGDLAEARGHAERSGDISEALAVMESTVPSSLPNAGIADRVRQLRTYVANRKLALREIEDARKVVETVQAELSYLAQDGAKMERAALSREGELKQAKERAEARLTKARRREELTSEDDRILVHISALVDHGRALGLQHGHCPLCDASRSDDQFESALSVLSSRIAERGKALREAQAAVEEAAKTLGVINRDLSVVEKEILALVARRSRAEEMTKQVRGVYTKHAFDAPINDPTAAQRKLFRAQESLVRAERALVVLENSSAMERVSTLEGRVAELRVRNEAEASKLSRCEHIVEVARQIDAASKTVANEILTEQFDTVMPLLKELYRRLRPHATWGDIDSDFGGKVRGTLNFVVGDGHNPQFLFSSGQRRAAGLSFLLAVHLSRPWCLWQSLLLDDPVQHIDDYRALNLVEVLAAVRRTGRQVIIAVEDSALAHLLCRRMRSSMGDPGLLYEMQMAHSGSSAISRRRVVRPMPHLALKPAIA